MRRLTRDELWHMRKKVGLNWLDFLLLEPGPHDGLIGQPELKELKQSRRTLPYVLGFFICLFTLIGVDWDSLSTSVAYCILFPTILLLILFTILIHKKRYDKE